MNSLFIACIFLISLSCFIISQIQLSSPFAARPQLLWGTLLELLGILDYKWRSAKKAMHSMYRNLPKRQCSVQAIVFALVQH